MIFFLYGTLPLLSHRKNSLLFVCFDLATTRRFQEDGQALSSQKATDLDPSPRGPSYGGESGPMGRGFSGIPSFAEKGYDIRVGLLGILAQEHLGPVRMRHHTNETLERASKLQEINEQQKSSCVLQMPLWVGLFEFCLKVRQRGLVGKTLTEEQDATYSLCVSSRNNLAIIQGRTGIGKSYVLDSVRAVMSMSMFFKALPPTNRPATWL